MRKYTFNKLRRLLSCLVMWSLCSLCGCLDTSTPQDKAFENKIIDTLKQDGDTVAVSDIHPGEWTKVCPLVEYQRALDKAAWALGIPKSQAQITNTHDELASSDQWGFVFIYPPDKAEYLRISKHFLGSGKDCVSRSKANFELVRDQGDFRYLRLTKKK